MPAKRMRQKPSSRPGQRTAHPWRAAAPARTPARAAAELAGLRLSNLDKVFYPATGFTKGQIIDYYTRIAPVLLPHLHSRPVTLKRYPSGVDGPFFYERMCPSHRPDFVATTRVATRTGKRDFVQYCVVDDLRTLIWIANLAAIELHAFLATTDALDHPTAMVFDHDPGPGTDILDCIRIALRFRDMLQDLGLKSLAKTSGGKGLHLFVPLNDERVTFDQTKALAKAMAQRLAKDDPRHITANMRKDMRNGRVLIDWSQNDHHKSTVCVYSLRARQHPTVSTPVTWEECQRALDDYDAAPLTFTADQTLQRVQDQGDLFAPVLTMRQTLPKLKE